MVAFSIVQCANNFDHFRRKVRGDNDERSPPRNSSNSLGKKNPTVVHIKWNLSAHSVRIIAFQVKASSRTGQQERSSCERGKSTGEKRLSPAGREVNSLVRVILIILELQLLADVSVSTLFQLSFNDNSTLQKQKVSCLTNFFASTGWKYIEGYGDMNKNGGTKIIRY